jgi:hypothetical protein
MKRSDYAQRMDVRYKTALVADEQEVVEDATR